MTFSSFNHIGTKMIYAVNKELKKVGLFLKAAKTKYYSKNECKLITGTVIDKANILKVPNKRRLSIINTYREYLKSDEQDKEKHKNSVAGKISSARQIEKEIFPNLFRELKKRAL